MSTVERQAYSDAAPSEAGADGGREFVGSLARGLGVIRAFGPEAREMTLSEVAQRTGLTRAAARRFLLTLRALGYVESEGRRFRLTPKVLSLGFAYLSSMTFAERAQPILERVSEQLGESCSVSVLDGQDVVYVARVPTKRIMSVSLSIGARLPAAATSMGRVLLAGLPEPELERFLRDVVLQRHTGRTVTDKAELAGILERVRRDGYCVVDQELEQGLRSIAAPIRSAAGCTLAAMNVGTHVARVPKDRLLDEYLPVLRAAAEELSRALG